MKVSEPSYKAIKFQNQNADLPLVESGVLIKVIEVFGWLKVFIEVDENATHENLRKAITPSLKWRDRLMKFQGPWYLGGPTDFKIRLTRMQQGGKSYREIAKMLNEIVLSHIKNDLENKRRIEEVARILGPQATFGDYIQYINENNMHDITFMEFDHAKSILSMFPFNDSEIDEIINDAVSSLQDDYSPFPDNYPITKRMVIDFIRQWKNSEEYKLVRKTLG